MILGGSAPTLHRCTRQHKSVRFYDQGGLHGCRHGIALELPLLKMEISIFDPLKKRGIRIVNFCWKRVGGGRGCCGLVTAGMCASCCRIFAFAHAIHSGGRMTWILAQVSQDVGSLAYVHHHAGPQLRAAPLPELSRQILPVLRNSARSGVGQSGSVTSRKQRGVAAAVESPEPCRCRGHAA